MSDTWRIDADFPGGNIIVDSVGPDSADIRQDLRDTDGWWFWWQFRVRGAQGRTLTFRHTAPKPDKSRRYPYVRQGPVVSLDDGLTWSWLGTDSVDAEGAFRYAFDPEASEARFAFGIPYVESDFQRFLARIGSSPALVQSELCRSRGGRSVHRLHAGCLDRPQYRLLITARHHACEAMANFVIEGMIETVLEESELGEWFRRRAELMIIPFVDTDGVEAGDQGKLRKPRDHARDYEGESLYPETAAVRRIVPPWLDGVPWAVLDVHCPSPMDGAVYIPGSADPVAWERQSRFGQILESSIQGPLPYQTSDNLPFGQKWNIGANFSAGKTCCGWAGGLPGIHLAVALEIPYSSARGVGVTPARARLFGHDLAAALRSYLLAPAPH